jgi:hypothetical protein
VFGLGILVAALVVPVDAAERPHLEFVNGLRQRNLGELAIEYLTSIQKRPDLPADVKEVLDLELAKSHSSAALETRNVDDARKHLTEAKGLLDKFVKEHANHPQVASASTTYGDLAFRGGQSLLRAALGLSDKDKEKKKTLMQDARVALEDSRPKYAKAVELYAASVTELVKQRKADQAVAAEKKQKVKKARTRAQRLADEALELAMEDWYDARFKLASVDYNVARTFADPKDPARVKALLAAAKAYDDIWQANRAFRIGLYAHMMNGRVVDEQGNLDLALELYEEVLANAPSDKNDDRPTPVFESLFAEVEYYKLLILEKQKKTDEIIIEVEGLKPDRLGWLDVNLPARRTNGYQGVTLMLAKAYLEKAKGQKGNDAKATFKKALSLLAAVKAVPSEYRDEAILLDLNYKGRADDQEQQIAVFADAMAIAKNALKLDDVPGAVSALKRAVELGKNPKDPKDPKNPKEDEVLDARFLLARTLLQAGNVAETLDVAEALAREKPDWKFSPTVASIGVSAALSLCATSQDKPAAQARLKKLVDFILEKWPKLAEADDARIAQGRLELELKQFDSALKTFETVNPASPRYPVAMHYAGQTHWRFYVEGKRKPDAGRQEKMLADHRQKAVQQLDLSLKQQRDAVKDKSAPLARQLTETQLLRAEISLEGSEVERALPLLEELIKPILAEKPKGLDLYGHRLFVATISALIKTKQKQSEDIDEQANEAARQKLEALRGKTVAALNDSGSLLLEIGGDLGPVNLALIEYSKSLKDDWKLAESKVLLIPATASDAPAPTEKPAPPPATAPGEKPVVPPATAEQPKPAAVAKPADAPKDATAAPAPAAVPAAAPAIPQEPPREKTPRDKAQDEATARKDAYGSVLLKLPARTQIALAELIYIADNCSELGSREAMERARVVYQSILERYSKAPPSSKEAAGAIVRCQSKLIALLRGEKKFDEALQQIDDLLKKQPNALEPAMEKASLLQAMAETDPKKYEEAAREWRALREKLRNPKIVRKPAEYYDIVYNLGYCLYELGVQTKDKTKVEESVSTLKATMTLAPKLGPGETTNHELKVKYEQLLDKGLSHLGRPTASTKK